MAGGDRDTHTGEVMFGEEHMAGHLFKGCLEQDAEKKDEPNGARSFITTFARFEGANEHQSVRNTR